MALNATDRRIERDAARRRAARVNLSRPAELLADVRSQVPGLNLSRALQETLREHLNCNHETLRCATCEKPFERAAVGLELLAQYYEDLIWELRALVARGGSAEGAARLAHSLAARYHVPDIDGQPLPRRPRALAQERAERHGEANQ